MLWQWGNLGLYSSCLTVGACSGHSCVYLRTGPEGTPALCNIPLPVERSRDRNGETVLEDTAEQWGEQNCKVCQEQWSTCSTVEMHPKIDGMNGKPGCSFCWLHKSFKVLFGKSSSNLVRNQDTALFHLFYFNHCKVFFFFFPKLVCIFTEKHFSVMLITWTNEKLL